MKYLITGATGFIGSALCEKLLNDNNQIVALSRNKKKAENKFKGRVRIVESLDEINVDEKFDAVINLAGAGIADKRWSKEQKEKLINSRINVTENLIALFSKLNNQPRVFVSASAIGYYGSNGDNILTESSKPNDEFTHQLCKKWEDVARKANTLNIRTCITRFGVVLGKNGGSLKKMLTPFKLGLGGKIGSGEQYFSWIHLDDVINAIIFLSINENSSGEFNINSPKAVTNLEFTKALGKALNRPTIFSIPKLFIKNIFGEMGEALLLKGQRVYPRKILDSGFKFKYENIQKALAQIVSN